jgi:hypothetical protein
MHILVDDHIGLRIGSKDRPAQARADVMRLAQGLIAVQFDMQVDEDPAARRARLQVVKARARRANRGRSRRCPSGSLGIGAPVHQRIPGRLADGSAPKASTPAAPSATTASTPPIP